MWSPGSRLVVSKFTGHGEDEIVGLHCEAYALASGRAANQSSVTQPAANAAGREQANLRHSTQMLPQMSAGANATIEVIDREFFIGTMGSVVFLSPT